jgi:hypothetical protein
MTAGSLVVGSECCCSVGYNEDVMMNPGLAMHAHDLYPSLSASVW